MDYCTVESFNNLSPEFSFALFNMFKMAARSARLGSGMISTEFSVEVFPYTQCILSNTANIAPLVRDGYGVTERLPRSTK